MYEKNWTRTFSAKWQVSHHGYSMITIRELFASGALKTKKLKNTKDD